MKARINKNTVMSMAWSIAKTAAKKFGGFARQYLSCALTTAWSIVKAATKNTHQYISVINGTTITVDGIEYNSVKIHCRLLRL